jgi:hypothetical protein
MDPNPFALGMSSSQWATLPAVVVLDLRYVLANGFSLTGTLIGSVDWAALLAAAGMSPIDDPPPFVKLPVPELEQGSTKLPPYGFCKPGPMPDGIVRRAFSRAMQRRRGGLL